MFKKTSKEKKSGKKLDQNKGREETDEYFSGGVAVFDVDENGVLSEKPVQTLSGLQFSRPEIASIAKDICAVDNTTNNTVNLNYFDGNNFPESPVKILCEHLSFPYEACLSPDKK